MSILSLAYNHCLLSELHKSCYFCLDVPEVHSIAFFRLTVFTFYFFLSGVDSALHRKMKRV